MEFRTHMFFLWYICYVFCDRYFLVSSSWFLKGALLGNCVDMLSLGPTWHAAVELPNVVVLLGKDSTATENPTTSVFQKIGVLGTSDHLSPRRDDAFWFEFVSTRNQFLDSLAWYDCKHFFGILFCHVGHLAPCKTKVIQGLCNSEYKEQRVFGTKWLGFLLATVIAHFGVVLSVNTKDSQIDYWVEYLFILVCRNPFYEHLKGLHVEHVYEELVIVLDS